MPSAASSEEVRQGQDLSAFYFAGRNWHNGMAWVYDYGGRIAFTKAGKWVGGLESPQSKGSHD